MISSREFFYVPDEYESEKASNSYLMSLVGITMGLILPGLNLLTTFFYFLGNRKGPFFVRWHCIQALLLQVLVAVVNTVAVVWTISVLFGPDEITDSYLGYIVTMIVFNITCFALTIHSAVQARKSRHVYWYLLGPVTDLICKGSKSNSAT